MIELGKKQKLLVVKTVDFGIYLGEDRNAPQNERVLLPSKQVPEGTKAGDEIEVFIYKDSQDRLIATSSAPSPTDPHAPSPSTYSPSLHSDPVQFLD